MKIEKVFDYKIYRNTCEESVYLNTELIRSVNDVLSMEEVTKGVLEKKLGNVANSSSGPVLSTMLNPMISFIYLPGSKELTNWVTEQFLLARDQILPSVQGNNIKFNISWINRMYIGSHGKTHRHYRETINGVTKPDLMGIFYAQVPAKCAPLIFVNNGTPQVSYIDIPKSDKYYINPKAGELIIHPANVWHAVELHEDVDSRTCYIFDVDVI